MNVRMLLGVDPPDKQVFRWRVSLMVVLDLFTVIAFMLWWFSGQGEDFLVLFVLGAVSMVLATIENLYQLARRPDSAGPGSSLPLLFRVNGVLGIFLLFIWVLWTTHL